MTNTALALVLFIAWTLALLILMEAIRSWLVAARGVQSTIHLASTGAMAVNARFTAFAVQVAIAAIWTWQSVGQLVAGAG